MIWTKSVTGSIWGSPISGPFSGQLSNGQPESAVDTVTSHQIYKCGYVARNGKGVAAVVILLPTWIPIASPRLTAETRPELPAHESWSGHALQRPGAGHLTRRKSHCQVAVTVVCHHAFDKAHRLAVYYIPKHRQITMPEYAWSPTM